MANAFLYLTLTIAFGAGPFFQIRIVIIPPVERINRFQLIHLPRHCIFVVYTTPVRPNVVLHSHVRTRTAQLHPRIHGAKQPVQQLVPEATGVARVVVVVVGGAERMDQPQRSQHARVVEAVTRMPLISRNQLTEEVNAYHMEMRFRQQQAEEERDIGGGYILKHMCVFCREGPSRYVRVMLAVHVFVEPTRV